MAGSRPGPLGTSGEPQNLNDGTMTRTLSPRPGSIGVDRETTWDPFASTTQVLLSPVFHNTVQVASDMTAPMAWDAYWRLAYDHADKALQARANELLKRE